MIGVYTATPLSRDPVYGRTRRPRKWSLLRWPWVLVGEGGGVEWQTIYYDVRWRRGINKWGIFQRWPFIMKSYLWYLFTKTWLVKIALNHLILNNKYELLIFLKTLCVLINCWFLINSWFRLHQHLHRAVDCIKHFHFTAYVSLSYLFMFVVLSFSLRERLC